MRKIRFIRTVNKYNCIFLSVSNTYCVTVFLLYVFLGNFFFSSTMNKYDFQSIQESIILKLFIERSFYFWQTGENKNKNFKKCTQLYSKIYSKVEKCNGYKFRFIFFPNLVPLPSLGLKGFLPEN